MTGHLLSLGHGGPSPLWYATRATGVVALILLTVAVVLGIAGTARFATPRWPRVVTAGLHRNIGLLVVAFVAAHVITTVLDTYAGIGWLSALVPFSSAYRPFWLSLGTITVDLLLAVVATSLLRARLGYRAWRAVHWLGYLSWPVALWHGLGTGTDARLPWLLALDAACLAAAACALWWRLSLPGSRPRPLTTLLVVVAVPVATIGFALLGPLQPGWARRAGTPVALLAGAAAPGTAPAPASAAGPAAVPEGGRFSGRVARTAGPADDEITIVVAGRIRGPGGPELTIILQGAPDGAGVVLRHGSVQIGAAGSSRAYSGPIVLLNGQLLVADLSGPAGSAARATISLAVRGQGASGRLSIAREAAGSGTAGGQS